MVGDHLSMGTKLVGDHLYLGNKLFGTICPWELNWLGTICPEGPINCGPIVEDEMSGDHMRLGPNVSSKVFMRLETNTFKAKIDIFSHLCLSTF